MPVTGKLESGANGREAQSVLEGGGRERQRDPLPSWSSRISDSGQRRKSAWSKSQDVGWVAVRLLQPAWRSNQARGPMEYQPHPVPGRSNQALFERGDGPRYSL